MPKKPPPKPPTKSGLRSSFASSLKLSKTAAVLPAYQYLFKPSRYKINHGGRGAGRSWNFARALILKAHKQKTRILCAREIQSSISESVHRLLSDQIEMLGLSDFFEIQQYAITGRNGSEWFFEGLRSNASKIKSIEGIDVVWIEEAENISDDSWSKLIPTIRKPGSEIWVTFNPFLESDPTYQRFVLKPPKNAVVVKTTYRDNPHFPQELEDERLYLQSVDDDAYRWIWEGECRTISDALILKGKFTIDTFEIQDHWSGPHFGLDLGFSRDPSAAVKLYIDDANRTLYVKSEMWGVGIDLDVLPHTMETAIPGISNHVVFVDCSQPAMISYIARHGIPRAVGAPKWSGSVNDGVAYLRSFQKIVIDPACKQFIQEARTYSFKVDRLTGLPLPEVEDRNNHLMDATVYALSPLIRNLPTSGFFSRSALLSHGRPIDLVPPAGRPQNVFSVVSITDRSATAVGMVTFMASPHYGVPLTVIDYDIAEMDVVLSTEWLTAAFARMGELSKRCNAVYPISMHIETDDLYQAVAVIAVDQAVSGGGLMHVYAIDEKKLATTLDDRALAVRSLVNGAQHVKIALPAFERVVTHRNITANHFLSQVLGYRAESRDEPLELASAFIAGVANPLARRF